MKFYIKKSHTRIIYIICVSQIKLRKDLPVIIGEFSIKNRGKWKERGFLLIDPCVWLVAANSNNINNNDKKDG